MMRTAIRLVIALGVLALLAWGQSTDRYYLVLLRSAPDRKPIDKAEADRIQAAHMANIHAMADSGVLVAAGPFEDNPPVIRGLFVFRTGSLEEARRIALQDPTVVERRNVVDIFSWMGPAGIGEEYKRLHKADPKTPEDMGVHPFCLLAKAVDHPDRERLMREHAAYLGELRGKGKLAATGPSSGYGDVVEDADLPTHPRRRGPPVDGRRSGGEGRFVETGVPPLVEFRPRVALTARTS